MWELAVSSEGQLRIAGLGYAYGLDMAAVLAFGRAAGICETAMTELLPAIEGEMARGINARMRGEHG